MNLFSVAPILLGAGLLVSSAYYRARRLEVPLWFAKQLARIGAFSILSLLIVGYCQLQREMTTTESRKVLANI